MYKTMTVHIRPRRDEIASAAIQGSGAVASAAGLVYLVLQIWPQQDALALAGVLVYGVSMIVAFLASAFYHGTRNTRVKPYCSRSTTAPFSSLSPAPIRR